MDENLKYHLKNGRGFSFLAPYTTSSRIHYSLANELTRQGLKLDIDGIVAFSTVDGVWSKKKFLGYKKPALGDNSYRGQRIKKIHNFAKKSYDDLVDALVRAGGDDPLIRQKLELIGFNAPPPMRKKMKVTLYIDGEKNVISCEKFSIGTINVV